MHLARPLAVLTALLLAGSAYATPIEMISNGGFESSSLQNGTWTVASSIDGWKTDTKGVEVRNNIAGSAFDGKNFVELDTTGNSWISQTLATTASAHYSLQFAYAPREGISALSNGIEVFWNDVSQGVFTGQGGNGNQWRVYELDLMAASNSSTLKFAAVGLSDSYGGSLDHVSLTAVPEPASMATMLLGLGMLGFARRKFSR